MITRYDEMLAQYEEFDRINPTFWKTFVRLTFDRIDKGFRHYGAQHGVFAAVRWEVDRADVDGLSTFKANNNFSAFYARRFMEEYPEHKGFFRLRTQTSKGEPATKLPPLGPSDFPYLEQ